MKRFLGIALILCMLICLLPANVFAATQIGRSDITVNEPEAGVKPIASATFYNQSLETVRVDWVGELDANGCFKANTAYTVNITIRIKAGQDKYFVDNGGFRINRKSAVMTSLSQDKQQAVISYTFNNGASAAGNEVTGDNSGEAATMQDRIDFNIKEPTVGEMPATTATTTHPDIEVTKVSWQGEFAADGTFQTAKDYKVTISFKIKDNVNKKITGSALQCKATVNGISNVYYKGGEEKSGFLIHTFEIAAPIPVVDMDHVYSQKEADAHWYAVNPVGPTEIIVNEGETLTGKTSRFTVGQTNSVKRIVLNYPSDSVSYSAAYLFHHFPNLEELWLSPGIDVETFIGEYEASLAKLTGDNLLMIFDSNNASTHKFTLFIAEGSIDGFTRDIDLIDNKGLLFRGNEVYQRFNTRFYSGDVMTAYKKGASGTREWCMSHDYSTLVYAPDRVCIMKSCEDVVTYYYSCSKCGKCEYDPNHTGLVNPNYTFEMDRIKGDHKMTDRNLSQKYFIGVNSRGERAYWISCAFCGATHGEVLYGYEQPKNAEWARENATVTKDYVDIAFAVRSDRYVTAKMSEWAQNDVQWASQNGILDLSLLGDDYTKPITRLQFASIAVKLAEVLTGKAITPAPSDTFKDSNNEYVLKAYAAGITSGTSPTTFEPDGTLTRQQMATFIYRALMYARDNTNIRYTIYTPQLDQFSDNNKIQSWARESMGFMNALGLVKGVSQTEISPDGKCTIEQAAAVANRSVNADQIGWYQVTAAGTYHYAPTDLAPTQATYAEGHRIWVSVPQSGGQKASETPDYYEIEGHSGWIETVHPFTGSRVWVQRDRFKPIKDLKPEDEANFNKFYGE